MARRIKKNGAYGSNLRVVDAFYNANRIEEVTVASDKPNSVTKLVNADMASEVKLQPSASETYTANGTYILEPYPTKDAIEQATITVAIPLEEEKTTTINVEDYTDPVEVTPSSGKTAMEKNTITLTGIPTIEDNKSTTINLSSYSDPVEIVPSPGSDAMEKATVTITGIPIIQTNKAAAISVQDYDPSSKPVVEPDDGYDAMAQSTITLTGLPEIKPMELATIDVSTYSDTVTVTPTGGYDAMEEAAITLTGIPTTEADKAATIDVSTYDPANKPVITPTSGYDTMAQSTVTLSNIPSTVVRFRQWYYTESGSTVFVVTNGDPGPSQDGQEVTVYRSTALGYFSAMSGFYYDASTDTLVNGTAVYTKSTITSIDNRNAYTGA